jgi:hypothetical protein
VLDLIPALVVLTERNCDLDHHQTDAHELENRHRITSFRLYLSSEANFLLKRRNAGRFEVALQHSGMPAPFGHFR